MPTFRQDNKLGDSVPLIKTPDIGDKQVTERKLADGSVTSSKLSTEIANMLSLLTTRISAFKVADNLSSLPTEENTIGWLVDNHLYVYVGNGSTPESGMYQDCGELRGPQGIQGEQGLSGLNGKSAYDIWAEQPGNEDKSEIDFLEFTRGSKGDKGDQGERGYDISNIEQIVKSTEDGGKNIIRVTRSDGWNKVFEILNGSKGSKGDKGTSIVKLEQTRKTTESSGLNTIEATLGDGTKESFEIYNGAKGEQGDKGEKGDKGDQGEIGPQGNSGIADASNKTLVNDAITGGETDFLSAEVGKLGILTYDCSKGGTVTHATLQDAINSVPTTFQKVGLTITYKSGNTIYRYTLKANAWSADPANWFSVEDKLSDLADNTEIRNEDGATFKTPFSYLNSNKYLLVELDSLGRVLAGTLSDGSHYAYNMNSETIDDLRERKVDKEEGMSMIKNEVKECFNVIKDGIYPFCIIDNNRRVHLYVDKNGKTHLFGEIESPTIDAINKKISPVLYTTDLDWNVFFTVGDSLCTSGIWQLALCKYRNCSYDVSYGAEVSNMGGTITLDDNFRCGQSRLKRVIEDKNPMILIYENYNDISCLKNIGNKDDLPYFIGDNVIINESFNSYEEASNYWTNNATELLASLEKKVGIVVKIPYNTRNQAGAVYVSGIAKNDGFLSLRVNMKEVNITIKQGDDSTEILRKIEEVNYPNCRNEKTENYVKFINNDGSQSWVEFTHTPQIDGVTFSINYLDATTYLCKTFVSKDINKWNDITCWKSFGEISLWSAYKGLIEYFLKKCPTQRLIWFIPRVVFLERNIESSSYNPKLWYEDGTINIAEYKKNVGENDTLANLQKEVCQMYGIECVDLNDMLGVNVVNESSWCNNHDVHPTEMLYNKWGWCISKLIK